MYVIPEIYLNDWLIDLLIDARFMHFSFLREDRLFLGSCFVFAGNVSLLSLISKDKVKVEPIVWNVCFALPTQRKSQCTRFPGKSPFEGAVIDECYFWTMKTIERTTWTSSDGMSNLSKTVNFHFPHNIWTSRIW